MVPSCSEEREAINDEAHHLAALPIRSSDVEAGGVTAWLGPDRHALVCPTPFTIGLARRDRAVFVQETGRFY